MQTETEGANLSVSRKTKTNRLSARAIVPPVGEVNFLAEEQIRTDLSEVIAENFGANATYVEGLLARWRSDPAQVDESWRTYFDELVGANGAPASPADGRSTTLPQADGSGSVAKPDGRRDGAGVAPAKAATARAPETAATSETQAQATPIRGAALKIVENMEASLSVPTATSQRRIPVKLLDENRRIINRHLEENDRRKASYTHLIAYAILRAIDQFPQLNDGFEVIDEQPSRVRRESLNLGIAIDLAKKDGTRTLLVPNIKNANELRFSEFLAAYDDVVTRARTGKLQVADFQGTTLSLTNPGTIPIRLASSTTSKLPRSSRRFKASPDSKLTRLRSISDGTTACKGWVISPSSTQPKRKEPFFLMWPATLMKRSE